MRRDGGAPDRWAGGVRSAWATSTDAVPDSSRSASVLPGFGRVAPMEELSGESAPDNGRDGQPETAEEK